MANASAPQLYIYIYIYGYTGLMHVTHTFVCYSIVGFKLELDGRWNDDYASKGYEYFDVWAPEMATHYG